MSYNIGATTIGSVAASTASANNLVPVIVAILLGALIFDTLLILTIAIHNALKDRAERTSAQDLFFEVYKTVKDHTLYPTQLPTIEHWQKHAPTIRSDIEAVAAASEALKQLKDSFASVKIKESDSPDRETRLVVSQTLRNNIGYLRIEYFDDSVPLNVHNVLKSMNVQALIIDLRGNRGGGLMAAVRTAAMFVESGTVVRIERRVPGGSDSPAYQDDTIILTSNYIVHSYSTKLLEPSVWMNGAPRQRGLLKEARLPYWANSMPIAVIVNGNTASAAELFTGALKDAANAKIVGLPTYGKGVGQSVLDVHHRAVLRITTFRFMTPSGYWPGDGASNRYGVKPHVLVDSMSTDKHRGQSDTDRSNSQSLETASGQLGTFRHEGETGPRTVIADADLESSLSLIDRMLIKQALRL